MLSVYPKSAFQSKQLKQMALTIYNSFSGVSFSLVVRLEPKEMVKWQEIFRLVHTNRNENKDYLKTNSTCSIRNFRKENCSICFETEITGSFD